MWVILAGAASECATLGARTPKTTNEKQMSATILLACIRQSISVTGICGGADRRLRPERGIRISAGGTGQIGVPAPSCSHAARWQMNCSVPLLDDYRSCHTRFQVARNGAGEVHGAGLGELPNEAATLTGLQSDHVGFSMFHTRHLLHHGRM